MSDIDLHIDQLNLSFDDCAGHQHRVLPIVRRALTLLEELAAAELLRFGADSGRIELAALQAGPIEADFTLESDDLIARRIATAWLKVLLSLNH